MSPSTSPQTRATGGKRRRVDFTRPPEAQPNHPVPYLGWDIRHAVPLRPSIAYSALCGLHPTLLPSSKDGTPRGAIVTASVTAVTRATARHMSSMTSALAAEPMARRTVGHCLEHLERKGFIERWQTESRHRNSPVGLSWRIVPWTEVLQRWADDPRIATAEGTRRGFYVWGKGRWHLSPADVAAWKVDGARSEADPAAHAAMSGMAEPVLQPAAAAPAKPRRVTIEEALIEDTAVVHRAISQIGITSAEPEHAAALLALAREVDAAIPADAIAKLILRLADGYVLKGKANPAKYGWTADGGPVFWTIGWLRNDLAGAVAIWRADRESAQKATGTAL